MITLQESNQEKEYILYKFFMRKSFREKMEMQIVKKPKLMSTNQLHVGKALHKNSNNISNIITEKKDFQVQTNIPCEPIQSEPHIILTCWQNSSVNEVSTQASINISKTVIEESTIISGKTKQSSMSSLPDSEIRFSGLVDIKDNTVMRQLGGIKLCFFSKLLQIIKCHDNYRPKHVKKISHENRLLLFLMKMKLGLNFSALGCIFNISIVSSSSIFYSILKTLFHDTKTWILWPTRGSIKHNMSPIFKNYKNCRAVIDIVKFNFYTSPNVNQKALLHSTYKGYFTVKCLIAISPGGLITFLSKVYNDDVSDGYILEDSGIFNILETDDVIISIKNLEEMKFKFEEKQCQLITLLHTPFNSQVSNEENLTDGFGKLVNIYVEKIESNLRRFQIFDNLTVELFPYIDNIISVASALANNINVT